MTDQPSRAVPPSEPDGAAGTAAGPDGAAGTAAGPDGAAGTAPEPHGPEVEVPEAPVPQTQVAAAFDRRKTIIGAILTVATLAVVFVGIIPKFGSYADAWDRIQSMSAADLVALGLSVVVMVVVYVLPYQAAIPGLRYRPAFVIRQTSFAISNAVPAGGAVGLALQYAMLSSYRVGMAAATAGIAVTSLWSILMTLTLPVLGVVAALSTGQVQQRWVWAAVAGTAATVVVVLLLWLILRSETSARRVGEFGNRLLAPVNRRRANPLDAMVMVMDLRATTADVLTRHWAWVTVSNYLVILAQFGVLWFAIRGVSDAGISPAGAFAAFAISRMASMIPITPGGLGTVDTALIALLVTFGLPQSEAVAATLVWRAASFIPQVCLGVATFIFWRVEVARGAGGPGRATAADAPRR